MTPDDPHGAMGATRAVGPDRMGRGMTKSPEINLFR